MREHKYILDENGEPVAEPNLMKWAKTFESQCPFVAKTDIGRAEVSTVFLGTNRQFNEGPPLLFETMIRGMPSGHELDDRQSRYATRAEALVGHTLAVGEVVDALQEEPVDTLAEWQERFRKQREPKP